MRYVTHWNPYGNGGEDKTVKRFKKWLLETFLPAWAKDTVYRDNAALTAELEREKQKIRELNAYIDGLEMSLRSIRRIVIQNGVRP